MKLIKLGLISALAAGSLFAGTYKLDIPHSHVGFKIKHMMISNVKGSFNEFNGEIEYDEKTKKLKGLTGTVEVASIDTSNKKRDEHLKSGDFFNIKKYPTMKLDLKKVSGNKAYANLTINGVTKEVKFNIEDNGSITDPMGNKRIGLTLEGEINRENFGITWNKSLDKGGVVVGKEVKLEIELEGISNSMNKM